MAFLNPILLFGLTAMSIPVIIHLLNRRKFEQVSWGAMRFLHVSVQQNQRRLQIEDLLLLLLRCLMLGLIALAVARPALTAVHAGFLGQAKITGVLILDNSYSMSQTDGVSSRFDKAKKSLEDALDTFPAGSSAAVILASDISDRVVREPTFDLNLARTVIRQAKFCDRGSDLLPAITDAVEVLKGGGGVRKEIYLATDGQANGWRQLDPICQTLDGVKDDVHAHVFLAISPETQNLGVSDMHLATEIPAVEQALRFDARVTNFGTADAASVHLALKTDDIDAPCDETTIESIPAGGSKIVSLFAKLHSDGYHTVTAALDGDRLPADDHRTLAVRAVSQVKVLLVDGDPGKEPRDAETFFLRHALVPVSPAEVDAYYIKATVAPVSELAKQNFEDYDCVILADVPEVPDETLEAIASYLRRGNSLMVFPGPNINASFYNTKMVDKWGFLPAQFGDARGDATQSKDFLTFQSKGFSHPIVSLWNDSAAGDPSKARIYRAFTLMPAAKLASPDAVDAGEPQVVLNFAGAQNSPAVMERPWASGHVVQFATTAGTKWTDLPAHAGLFVPLVRRTLGWLIVQQDRSLNVVVGQTFVFHPPASALSQDLTITPPGTDANAPKESRHVELVDRVPTLSFADTNAAGAYTVDGIGKPVKFAVQQQPSDDPFQSESSLTDLSEAQMATLAKSAQVFKPGDALAEMVEKERVGTELWLQLAIAALVLATAETFLAHWFSLPK